MKRRTFQKSHDVDHSGNWFSVASMQFQKPNSPDYSDQAAEILFFTGKFSFQTWANVCQWLSIGLSSHSSQVKSSTMTKSHWLQRLLPKISMFLIQSTLQHWLARGIGSLPNCSTDEIYYCMFPSFCSSNLYWLENSRKSSNGRDGSKRLRNARLSCVRRTIPLSTLLCFTYYTFLSCATLVLCTTT